MTETASELRARLIRHTGLSDSAINAAWPDWWSEAAEASPSAQAELRFSIARKLGLDARSMLGDEEPRFIWDDTARFKGFSGDPAAERPAIASFGTAVSRMLLQATSSQGPLEPVNAAQLRQTILATRPTVGLIELLTIGWSLGIAIIHLRVYPLTAKRMSAMSVRVGDRYAILVARDAVYPAPVAFHVAHELGHIFLGHLSDGRAIVDLESLDELTTGDDLEERAADEFALELLTGRPRPELVIQGQGTNARQLAQQAQRIAQLERIEPGTLALTFGHATSNWATAMAALPHIYAQTYDAWRAINQIAANNLLWSALSDESDSFLRAVMGGADG